MKVLFLHGWTSTPGGKKTTFLKEHGHEVIKPTTVVKSAVTAHRLHLRGRPFFIDTDFLLDRFPNLRRWALRAGAVWATGTSR